jgi:NADPH:quinone reductase-like Zn-dependent oxidoreductase
LRKRRATQSIGPTAELPALREDRFCGEIVATTSTKNVEFVKSLGPDLAIDYKTQDLETTLSGYDLVLHSEDAKTLEKSLRVLKLAGLLILISGPPDPEFATELG